MRLLLTIATYLATLAVVAVVAFFVVIFLAGPHAGLLPHALEVVVLILGWLSVLVLPFLGAWAAWRRLNKSSGPSDPTTERDARESNTRSSS
jgi:ABC-type nickel/cobalt efflux system permease component RcnA